ncbi:MAG: 5-(carboxyamino)imidazole ribonucleotide mutase [Myxococcota bacterium]
MSAEGSPARPVLIAMGSASDLPVMRPAADVLGELGVESDVRIVSAHRTPELLVETGRTAVERGYRVIIAGAGGAAHLPGMLASLTPLPVIGVPVKARISLDGWDSLLSIVQMPPGVPVATVAIDGGKNAGILAAQILGASLPSLLHRVADMKEAMRARVLTTAERLIEEGPPAFE